MIFETRNMQQAGWWFEMWACQNTDLDHIESPLFCGAEGIFWYISTQSWLRGLTHLIYHFDYCCTKCKPSRQTHSVRHSVKPCCPKDCTTEVIAELSSVRLPGSSIEEAYLITTRDQAWSSDRLSYDKSDRDSHWSVWWLWMEFLRFCFTTHAWTNSRRGESSVLFSVLSNRCSRTIWIAVASWPSMVNCSSFCKFED